LRKTEVYPSEERSLFAMFHGIRKHAADALFVPCWFADVYTNLGAAMPQTMNTDEIDAVRKHSEDFVRSVKTLDEEIDKTVREKFSGGILDKNEEEAIKSRKLEFNERWRKDVAPAFEDISKVEKWWSVGLTGTIVGSALALGALVNVVSVPPALIAALAGAKNIKKLVDPAAKFLSTFFECNPIHLGFYKVHRELKKVEQGSR
jgi:hypothetical protein